MKRKIVYIFLFIILSNINNVFAEDTSLIYKEQIEQFGITDFINETNKYKSDILENIDINELLNSAITGNIDSSKIFKAILKVLGKEISQSIGVLISILIVIVIHAILKSVSDNLEGSSISTIIFYVEYILIVTLILSNFTSIISLIKTTSSNLVGFINMLIPILITLMIYTGSTVTTGMLEPIILFMVNFIGNIIEDILIPVILIIIALSVVSKISDKVQIEKISKFMKSGVVWFLGIILTIFVGVISLEGTLGSSIDGVTAKTLKTTVSNIIPVVGKILSDSVDVVLGCGVVLKNALGVVGVIVVIGISIIPIIKLGILSVIYSFASSVIQPIADKKIVGLLEEMSGIFKILFGILCGLSVMVIIGVTLVVKISNSGMMYR